MHETNNILIIHWQRTSRIVAVLSIILALLGLSGQLFSLPVLQSGLSDGATMKVNTALSLLVLGGCLLLLHQGWILTARAGLAFVLLITFLTLLEYTWNLNTGIDQWFMIDSDLNSGNNMANRMSVLTASGLTCVALATLAISFKRYITGQLLAITLFILFYASLISNIYGIKGTAYYANYTSIANHTAAALLFLSLGLLLYRPGNGWVHMVSSKYSGGQLARYTFSYFLLVAPLFIGFYLFTLDQWKFSPGLSIISLFLLTCLITLPITYFYLERLNKVDSELRKAHHNLQVVNKNLKERNGELSVALAEVQEGNRELAIMAREVITSSKAVEEKNKELLRINQGLDFIVHMASHDLKTPIFNLEILFKNLKPCLNTHLNAEDSPMVTMVDDSIKSLKNTIEGLTQVIMSQQTIIGMQVSVSVIKLVQEIQKELVREIEASQAQIALQAEVDTIVFPQIHLRSIFFNLISNGIKYRSPDRTPVLQIKTAMVPGGVEVIFCDNGLGMSQNQLSQLFTIFKRFHDHVEGSGIGLYIVKQTIENNGGTIRAESVVGEGTRFIIFLPQST